MNYPPGVTGNEIQITGSDEYTAEREVICWEESCQMFEKAQTVELEVSSDRFQEWADWTCSTCKTEQVFEKRVPLG
jgi:hypothetical protein